MLVLSLNFVLIVYSWPVLAWTTSVFHPSFTSVAPWVLVIVWESDKYRFIEFFVFGHDSLPYLPSVFSGRGLLFL